MGVKVKLEDIIEEMDFQSYEITTLLNIKTGEVVTVQNEFLGKAEDGEPFDHMHDWMQEALTVAYDIVEHEEDYRKLPSTFDINEYQMMEDFCFGVKNERKRNRLLRAINGKGAFRRFKDTAIELDLIDDWYEYRDERYKQIAIEYCEGLGLDYVE